MKDKKNILLVVACVICLAVISCQSAMDRFTPCPVTEQSYEYVHGSLDGYKEIDSLHNVKKLRDKAIIKHRRSLLDLKRALEDEGYEYDDAIGMIQAYVKESQALQDLIIGGEGQDFSVMGILLGLTGGAAIGRALKRKGDYSPDEVEAVVAKAKRRVD